MRISYSANSLQDATKETLEESTQKYMKKIHRLVDNIGKEEPVLRLSVEKEAKGDIFDINAELVTYKHGTLYAKAKNRNLRLAVSEVSKELKMQLSRDKDKRKR